MIYLLRHAESAPDDKISEKDWPLSETGSQQAEGLIPVLEKLNIDTIVSSPYLRAVKTVEPFATKCGLAIHLEEEFRERILHRGDESDLVDKMTWRKWIENSWQDYDFAPPNSESFNQCLARMIQAVSHHASLDASLDESRVDKGNLLISSHGTIISLFMTHLNSGFGIEGWFGLRNPDLLEIHHSDAQFVWNREFTYSRVTLE